MTLPSGVYDCDAIALCGQPCRRARGRNGQRLELGAVRVPRLAEGAGRARPKDTLALVVRIDGEAERVGRQVREADICLEIHHGLRVVLLVERPNGWRTEHKGLVQLARVDGRVVAARTLQEILGELHHIEPDHGRRRGLGPDDGRPTRGAAAAVLQRRTREYNPRATTV